MNEPVWTRVQGAATVPSGGLRKLIVGERVFVVVNRAGDYFVLEGRCTHKPEALLGEGILFGDAVMCPWHGYRYDIRTGRNVHPGHARPVGCIPVRVEGDDLLLDLSRYGGLPIDRDRG